MSHTIAQHRRHHPMWFYEKNYSFLRHLIPDLKLGHAGQYQIKHEQHLMNIEITDFGPYTQRLELSQQFAESFSVLGELRMCVRVYHDAMLAEVIGYQGIKRLLARYELPNKGMLHPDEKRQANLLLHDWLTMYINQFRQAERAITIS